MKFFERKRLIQFKIIVSLTYYLVTLFQLMVLYFLAYVSSETLNNLEDVVKSSVEKYETQNSAHSNSTEKCTTPACRITDALSFRESWNDYLNLFKNYVEEERHFTKREEHWFCTIVAISYCRVIFSIFVIILYIFIYLFHKKISTDNLRNILLIFLTFELQMMKHN